MNEEWWYEPLTPPGVLTTNETACVAELIEARQQHLEECMCEVGIGATTCVEHDEDDEPVMASLISLQYTPEVRLVHIVRQYPEGEWDVFIGRINARLVGEDGEELL